MPRPWPQFSRPTPLPDGGSWTAVFDSFDQRTDDVYYYLTVIEPGRDPAAFFGRVSVPPEEREASGPGLRAQLREELNRLAESGRTNTEYQGSLRGWEAGEWLKARKRQKRTPEDEPAKEEASPPPGRFFTSANGRLSYEMENEPSEQIFPLISFLEERFGFDFGFPIFGLDGVYAEGAREGTKIVAGYDNWSGCFIQALDEAGDGFVRKIGGALNAGPTAAPSPTESGRRSGTKTSG